MKNLRKEMERNAKAYNKYLSTHYLRGLTDHELLCLTHPLRREEYIRKLTKLYEKSGSNDIQN